MSKGYYILVLIFCLTYKSHAGDSRGKTAGVPAETAAHLPEAVQWTVEKAGSAKPFSLKVEMCPASNLMMDYRDGALLSMAFGGATFSLDKRDGLRKGKAWFQKGFESAKRSGFERIAIGRVKVGQAMAQQFISTM